MLNLYIQYVLGLSEELFLLHMPHTYVLNTKCILYSMLTFLPVKLTNMQIIKDVRALKKHLVTKVKSNDNDDK